MNITRRGLLGLLGPTTAALPFLGLAVMLNSDPKTGALTVGGDVLSRDIIPVNAGQEFLVIPVNKVRSLSSIFHTIGINITALDSCEYMDFSGLCTVDLSVEADSDMMRQFSSAFSNARRT